MALRSVPATTRKENEAALRNRITQLERQLEKSQQSSKSKGEDLRSLQKNLREVTVELKDCKAKLDTKTTELHAKEKVLKKAGRKLTRAKAAAGGTGSRRLPAIFLVFCVMYLIVAGLSVLHFLYDIDEGDGSLTDAYYTTSVTVFGVGYGDSAPDTAIGILLVDLLPMLGYFVPFVFSHFLGRLAGWIRQTLVPVRIRFLCAVISAIGTIMIAILSGMLGLCLFDRETLRTALSEREHLSASLAPLSTWADVLVMFHLAVMTMTTTGYGDFAFRTAHGRLFAAFWIPYCTTSYSVAMTFLVESILVASAHY